MIIKKFKWFLIQICCDFHLVFLGFTKKNVIGFPRKAEGKGSKGSLPGRTYSSVTLQGDTRQSRGRHKGVSSLSGLVKQP